MIRRVATETAAESLDLADADAMCRLARGETRALGAVYDRHHAAIRRFIANATGEAHDVEDLTHATFLTAAKAASSFDGRASCRPWLFGIAVRLLSRRRRSGARWSRALRELATRQGGAHVDPHRHLSVREDLNAVSGALNRLSDAKRVVLCLAEVEGLSCADIARTLEVPVGTVWTRLHHARQELRLSLRHGN
jgi:RNA polymerase sigma-70 factor (ECF subfamily)